MSAHKPPYHIKSGHIEDFLSIIKNDGEGGRGRLSRKLKHATGKRLGRMVKACKAFDLIEEDSNGDFHLTERGEKIISGKEESRKEAYLNLVRHFEPYSEFLERIRSENSGVLTKGEVSTVFANNFDFSERTSEAATFTFFDLADSANLGDYIRGQKGYETRLEWNEKLDLEEYTPETKEDGDLSGGSELSEVYNASSGSNKVEIKFPSSTITLTLSDDEKSELMSEISHFL
jgi:hypothetical protein